MSSPVKYSSARRNPLDECLDHLREVKRRYPDLVESRFVGTERPIVSTRDRDRVIGTEEGLGSTAAPIHVDVLDAMARLVMWADMLHERIAQCVGHDRLSPAISAYEDPARFLDYVIELLPEAADTNPKVLDHAAAQADRMRQLVLSKLGEIYDGQELDALCPFCLGVTFRHPAGVRTLRVRVIESRRHDGEEFVLVCENPGGCTPLAAECGLWVQGRPAWPWPDWDWLAARLLPVERAALKRRYPQT